MHSDRPTVTVREGRLVGVRVDGVQVFRSIPYAAPPIGDRRFRPPIAPASWAGERDATAFGPIAPQTVTQLEILNGNDSRVQDEDCLTLNVWTPSTHGGSRPVMVWIHGGAFLTGSGATPTFDGTSFAARHDVVVVTINYRLNIFGFLHLGGIDAAEQGSGNCGLLDQIAALRWVRDNIAGFGGDPGNVTIFGESAGAMSVGTLLATPAAEGLFHRAVLQSGAASSTISAPDAEDVTAQVLACAGLTADAAGIAALRALPTTDLLALYSHTVQHMAATGTAPRAGFSFAPVVDGAVLPADPLQAIASGASRDLPVIIGTTRDEMEIMNLQIETFYAFGEDELLRRFDALFTDRSDEASTFYRRVTAGSGRNPWTAVDTDKTFMAAAVALAEARWAAGATTWMYWFTWATEAFGGRLGSYHTLEIPFVFDSLDRGAAPKITHGPPDHARVLATQMNATWAAFARTGNPNNGSIPSWDTYRDPERTTMVFDRDCRAVDDPYADRRRFWASLSG